MVKINLREQNEKIKYFSKNQKFFERIKQKLHSQINQNQRNKSNGSSKSKTNLLKRLSKKNRLDSQELKRLFLLNVRERSCQIQEKEIEEYETRIQLLKQTTDLKPPNQDQDLKCKICNYYFIYPIVLRCSHTFCERCLDEYSTRQQYCIECEEPLSHSKYIKSETLQSIVEKHLHALGAKQHQTYQNTKKMRDELRIKRYIKDFSVNQNIDIRDKYFDWYEAQIMNIIISGDKKYLVIQHKNSQSKVEIINSLSPNIAPYGFFTKRKDLKTRDEKKLDIVKSLVNQYEEIRSQRRQSQQEQQQQQQQQSQDQQNQNPENQENFHNIILRHLTSVQSLPYMISLMNGAMRRSESQQRILNTLQITVNNNNQQQDGNQQESQGQIQQQQQQSNVQQEIPIQPLLSSNNPAETQSSQQQNNNPQEGNIENSQINDQNGNNEEQTEIVIEEYEAENEDEDEEYLDEDQDILSNSQYSYQNLDAIQYVQEWQ